MERPVHNAQIAAIFENLADLLEIEGANPFRVRAYRTAARQVTNLPCEASEWPALGKSFADLPGIGTDLAGKIEEVVKTGELRLFNEVAARTPVGLVEIVRLPGIGPKRARLLHHGLKVNSIEGLEARISSGAVADLPGFGKATIARISSAIKGLKLRQPRLNLREAEASAEPMCSFIAGLPSVRRAVIAGSYRRCRDTVGDIDILVTADAPQARGLVERFATYPEVASILAQGGTKASLLLKGGLQVDLRLVEEKSFGAALLYLTGSKDHNIAIRNLALKAGLKINEYGAFRKGRLVAGRTEEEIYHLLGMDWIAPELRENRGEIEAALQHHLPELVRPQDIRGDLHVHTLASDGTQPIAEMAAEAAQMGYDYLAISDHVTRMKPVHGLNAGRLLAQIEEIEALQPRFKTLRLLKSCEVDILPDGSLDMENAVLARLDFVCGAIHSAFGLSEERQTERIIRAMDNPCLSILVHPTGRLINKRPPCQINMARVLQAARERGCILEINAQPDRQDLDDVNCRLARDMGVRMVISSDAHSAGGLHQLRFGLNQARRGWLAKGDVANTLKWPELRALLKRETPAPLGHGRSLA